MSNKVSLEKKVADFIQEVPVIFKGSDGYGYKFANWSSILEVVNPLMKKHGIGFVQGTRINETLGVTIVYTKVFDADTGDGFTSEMILPYDVTMKGMSVPQSIGSMITYFKRYQLSAMLGLVTDVDLDASDIKASKELKKESKASKTKGVLKELTDEVKASMMAYIEQGKASTVEKQLVNYAPSDNSIEVFNKIKELKDK